MISRLDRTFGPQLRSGPQAQRTARNEGWPPISTLPWPPLADIPPDCLVRRVRRPVIPTEATAPARGNTSTKPHQQLPRHTFRPKLASPLPRNAVFLPLCLLTFCPESRQFTQARPSRLPRRVPSRAPWRRSRTAQGSARRGSFPMRPCAVWLYVLSNAFGHKPMPLCEATTQPAPHARIRFAQRSASGTITANTPRRSRGETLSNKCRTRASHYGQSNACEMKPEAGHSAECSFGDNPWPTHP